jgi:hypothetical protein
VPVELGLATERLGLERVELGLVLEQVEQHLAGSSTCSEAELGHARIAVDADAVVAAADEHVGEDNCKPEAASNPRRERHRTG